MELRSVPGTDLRLSQLGLGGWLTLGGSVADAEAQAVLHAAMDGGINFIDVADSYARSGAEPVVGQFLRGRNRDHPFHDQPGRHRHVERAVRRTGVTSSEYAGPLHQER